MPSDIGFKRMKDNESDDVLGWVPINDIVEDLAEFFLGGGRIEAGNEKTPASITFAKFSPIMM